MKFLLAVIVSDDKLASTSAFQNRATYERASSETLPIPPHIKQLHYFFHIFLFFLSLSLQKEESEVQNLGFNHVLCLSASLLCVCVCRIHTSGLVVHCLNEKFMTFLNLGVHFLGFSCSNFTSIHLFFFQFFLHCC